MTNEQFIDTIRHYYIKSRDLTIDNRNYMIWRGVSHSVSSQSEDLFALFVAERLKDKSLEFIVDKTMSYKLKDGKSIQFRPDLMIVKDGLITHILDLKMDMGYKRRYFETPEFKKEEAKFKLFRDQSFEEITYNEGNNKKRYFRISKHIKNQIVVISEKNEGKANNRIDMIEAIKDLDWINLYYLTGGVHPNNYDYEKPILNQPEFKRLFDDIKVNLK